MVDGTMDKSQATTFLSPENLGDEDNFQRSPFVKDCKVYTGF